MMEIKDISELPIIHDESKENLEECLKRIHSIKKVESECVLLFSKFWELIESDGVSTIFNKGGRYIILKQKNKEINGEIKMNGKMIFADAKELPKTHKGKNGTNWMELFSQIPKGKMWVTDAKEYNASTLRQGLKQLVDEKKVKDNEYTITQREDTAKKQTIIYVIHNADKQ